MVLDSKAWKASVDLDAERDAFIQLGLDALRAGVRVQAAECFHDALVTFREQFGLCPERTEALDVRVTLLMHLGYIARDAQRWEDALGHFHEALVVAAAFMRTAPDDLDAKCSALAPHLELAGLYAGADDTRATTHLTKFLELVTSIDAARPARALRERCAEALLHCLVNGPNVPVSEHGELLWRYLRELPQRTQDTFEGGAAGDSLALERLQVLRSRFLEALARFAEG